MAKSDDSHSDQGYGYGGAETTADNKGGMGHMERRLSTGVTADDVLNPLSGLSQAQVIEEADAFVNQFGFESDREIFRLAALVSQRPKQFEGISQLQQEHIDALAYERDHIWSQTKSLMFSGKHQGVAEHSPVVTVS